MDCPALVLCPRRIEEAMLLCGDNRPPPTSCMLVDQSRIYVGLCMTAPVWVPRGWSLVACARLLSEHAQRSVHVPGCVHALELKPGWWVPAHGCQQVKD